MEGTQEYIDYLKDQNMDMKLQLDRATEQMIEIERKLARLQGTNEAANTLMMKAADLLK